MELTDLEWIRHSVREDTYFYSRHGDQERGNDGLTLVEVEQAILTGRMLEQYDDTGRGESCLVVGFTHAGKPVHVVCGQWEERMVIITVYIPGPPKFKTPFERGD
ncbi:MAG: DUF4258 domain-containing protein [Magnetococcales bacterium]|nr:DUF4258 domain-containing protein [Magnetococcales bacterium]MBF0321952.1 DUF4258 domain-containing protein [Magnetococcales bacterium]